MYKHSFHSFSISTYKNLRFLIEFSQSLITIFYFTEWKLKKCDINSLDSNCDSTERCVMPKNSNDTAWCECRRGFELIDGKCVETSTTAKVLPTTLRPDPKPSSGGGLRISIFSNTPSFQTYYVFFF